MIKSICAAKLTSAKVQTVQNGFAKYWNLNRRKNLVAGLTMTANKPTIIIKIL